MTASFLETWGARQVNSVLMENTLSQDGFTPQCSGLGVIDCTGECAGTEEEFKEFMDVMYDKDFEKKFPELAKEKQKIRWQGDVKRRFKNDVLKCTNFSPETMALLSLVNPNEEGGEMFCHIC